MDSRLTERGVEQARQRRGTARAEIVPRALGATIVVVDELAECTTGVSPG